MIRLLVVDDDTEILESLVSILQMIGYTVDATADSNEAISKLHNNNYDLIISDIIMPPPDGFDILSAFNKITGYENTPFIFLTANNQEKVIRKAMNLGVDDFIFKPFTPEKVIDSVVSHLKKADRINIITKIKYNRPNRITYFN